MRGIYDIESLYKHINKGSGRKFLSKLLFNRPKQEIKINRVKKKPKYKTVWKVRLCRTFANKDQHGNALTKWEALKKKTWQWKYGRSVRNRTVDYEKYEFPDIKKWSVGAPMVELGEAKNEKFTISKAWGYYPHIYYKGEWRPLFIKVHWNKHHTRPLNIILNWYEGKKHHKKDLSRLINEFGNKDKIALDDEKFAKTKRIPGRSDNHSIIDIKNDSFDGLRGNSRKTSKSFKLGV